MVCHGMSRYGGEWKTSLRFCITSLGANPLPDGIAIDRSFSRPHAGVFSQHASARGALPDRLAPAVVFVPIPRLDCRSALDEQTLHTQSSILFRSSPARADKPPRPEAASCSMRLSLRFLCEACLQGVQGVIPWARLRSASTSLHSACHSFCSPPPIWASSTSRWTVPAFSRRSSRSTLRATSRPRSGRVL